jgi:hypothetical protein
VDRDRCKRLIEAPDNRTPRLHITPAGRSFLDDIGFPGVYGAMWHLFAWPLEGINPSEATASFDTESKCYVLRGKLGGSSPAAMPFVLTIDPARDYIPLKKEFARADGAYTAYETCSDFVQTPSGLWVPRRFTIRFASELRPRLFVHDVNTVKINQPIPDDLLDIDVPPGTIVHDEIRGIKYKVEDRAAQAPPNQPSSSLASGTIDTGPASEQDLVAAADKAKQLLAQHAPTESETPKITVSPSHAFVTSDKSEYRLKITKPDGAALAPVSHSFQPQGLELVSLTTTADLTVNIRRETSHTGFAKGILSLRFADQPEPVEVIFVAPPLADSP